MANPDHAPCVLLVLGGQGSGKTTLLRQMVEGWRKRWLVVHDTVGQWRRLGAVTQSNFSDAARNLAANGCVVWNPQPKFGSDFAASFNACCDFVWRSKLRLNQPLLFVVEEIGSCMNGGNAKLPVPFRNLIFTGREQEIDIAASSQCANQVHFALRQQATHSAVFRHEDRLQLDWIEELGIDRETVKALPRFAYVFKRQGQPGEIRHGQKPLA